jgi:hypothetical protein
MQSFHLTTRPLLNTWLLLAVVLEVLIPQGVAGPVDSFLHHHLQWRQELHTQ